MDTHSEEFKKEISKAFLEVAQKLDYPENIFRLNTIIPKTIYQSDFCAFTRTTPNVFVPVGDPEV